jgi:Family of unknown function (DUF6790)
MGSFVSLVFVTVLAIAGAAVQLVRSRQPRTLGRASEVFLVWFLVWLLVVWAGIGAVLAFLSHTLLTDQTARAIGWPTGNPFQSEVAVANLVVGVLGILCYWIRGNFWSAAVIATSVWLLGDAVVHIYHIVVNQNYHPGNARLPFYYDILLPLLLIVLLIVYRVSGGGSGAERAPRVV